MSMDGSGIPPHHFGETTPSSHGVNATATNPQDSSQLQTSGHTVLNGGAGFIPSFALDPEEYLVPVSPVNSHDFPPDIDPADVSEFVPAAGPDPFNFDEPAPTNGELDIRDREELGDWLASHGSSVEEFLKPAALSNPQILQPAVQSNNAWGAAGPRPKQLNVNQQGPLNQRGNFSQHGISNQRGNFNQPGNLSQHGNFYQHGKFYQQGSTFIVAPDLPQAGPIPFQNPSRPSMPPRHPSYGVGPSRTGNHSSTPTTAAANSMVSHQPQPHVSAPPPSDGLHLPGFPDQDLHAPPPTQSRPPPDFLDLWATFALPDRGMQAQGTYRDLYHQYPELQSVTSRHWTAWKEGKLGVQENTAKRTPGVSFKGEEFRRAQNNHRRSNVAGVPKRPFFDQDSPAQSPAQSYASTPQWSTVATPQQLGGSEDQSQNALIIPDDDDDDDDDVDFDLEHHSIDAAHEYIERPAAEDCEKLNIENDDWEDHTNFSDEFKSRCAQLFNALRHPGSPMPNHYTDEEKAAYAKKQIYQYNQVLGLMKTPEQLRAVKARVIKAMAAIVRIHEVGVPKTMLQGGKTGKTSQGYDIDDKSTCKARAQKAINHTKACKYIALDILKSLNLVVFALSPDAYLRKKYENNKNTTDRSVALKKGTAEKKARKGADGTASGTPQLNGYAASSVSLPMGTPIPGGLQFNGTLPGTGFPQGFNVNPPVAGWMQNPNVQGGHGPAPMHYPPATANAGKRVREDGEEDLGDEGRYGSGAGKF